MNDAFNAVAQNFFDGALANRIGLTLLHSVWQIGLLTLFFAIVRFALTKQENASKKIYCCLLYTSPSPRDRG